MLDRLLQARGLTHTGKGTSIEPMSKRRVGRKTDGNRQPTTTPVATSSSERGLPSDIVETGISHPVKAIPPAPIPSHPRPSSSSRRNSNVSSTTSVRTGVENSKQRKSRTYNAKKKVNFQKASSKNSNPSRD
eukprot:Lankesteria_metandrocarpae@DN8192_c0_g1_i1.p2